MNSIRRQRFYLRATCFIFLSLFSSRVNSAVALPPDFSIRAAFFPGAGLVTNKNSEPWRLTIKGDGKVIQEISIIESPPYPRHISKSFRLSREQLANLAAAIVQQTDFFSLPEHISEADSDHYAGCVLTIRMRDRTRRVKFVWLTDEKATHNRPALTRFWKVWRAVLKNVPSPNRNSEAVWWLQHVRPDLITATR